MATATARKTLTFTGMRDMGLNTGIDLQYGCTDPAATLFLCVGTEANRVKVTGTTRLTRQAAVLKAIDDHGKWAQPVSLWMVAEKAGTITEKVGPVSYVTHVKPFMGSLTISGIKADDPRMVYPGNGKGRLLSKEINGRYYFVYGGKLETLDTMRGFDCTSFPMALLGVRSIAQPGYGKQLCDAVNACKCDLEQVSSADLSQRFKDDLIPFGLYILFSAGHVLLYNSDINTLYEFTYGGFKATPAGMRELQAPQNLWWMRKIDESYRPLFA